MYINRHIHAFGNQWPVPLNASDPHCSQKYVKAAVWSADGLRIPLLA